jgi:Domain of unknown function (DUF4124)
MRKFPFLCLALAVMSASVAGAAEFYRWRDAKGVWHYSDTPVNGAERVGVKVAPAATTTPAPAADTSGVVAPPAPVTARGQQAGATARVQQDLAAQRAEGCRKARETYDQAIAARRLYRAGKDGEAVMLSDAEVEAHRVAARIEMEGLCGK